MVHDPSKIAIFIKRNKILTNYNFYLQLKMQAKINVWLDCDPGLDDTFAIILAAKSSRINLIGVSTSAGNTNLDNTTKNALDVLHNIQRDDVVVVRGSQKLVHGKEHLAEHMHGSGGLGGVQLPPSPKHAITQNNFKAIRDFILASQQKVVWVNTGALTNLCFLFRQFAEVKQKIQKIVIMGGAIGKGNISPAAQFNIFFDPVAYKQVLEKKQKIPLVMIPLELTHEVKAGEQIFNFLQKRDHPLANAILNMLKSFQKMYFQNYQFDHPPIHDPTTINYLLHPEHFEVKKAIIQVDVGQTSYGRTNCYFKSKDTKKQFDTIDLVAIKMKNRRKFWGQFEKIFQKLFKEKAQ